MRNDNVLWKGWCTTLKEKITSLKVKVGGCLGIIVLVTVLASSPYKGEHTAFGAWLDQMGDKQQEYADQQTNAVVAPAEGDIVGNHEIDGSNWAIPNIIAHWLGQN